MNNLEIKERFDYLLSSLALSITTKEIVKSIMRYWLAGGSLSDHQEYLLNEYTIQLDLPSEPLKSSANFGSVDIRDSTL